MFSENSPYFSNNFNGNGSKLFPIRKVTEKKQLSIEDYVAIICDVLRMKKNICLCRHFHRMDKVLMLKNNHAKYIDVWPINVFDPKTENPFDVVSLFMMQLSCIINMLPAWKRLHLRVFLCESDGSNETRYIHNKYSLILYIYFFLFIISIIHNL